MVIPFPKALDTASLQDHRMQYFSLRLWALAMKSALVEKALCSNTGLSV